MLVIGIAGGTWRVLSPAIEQGHMPFLRHLVNSGSSGTLFSTLPALTEPAWASLQTGRNPGGTGVFCSTVFDRAARKMRFVNATSLQDTIWERISRAGKSVVVLNAPLTWPPRPVNGAMVTGSVTPSLKSDLTWPSDLGRELLIAVPGYRFVTAEENDRRACKDVESFVSRMVGAVATRARAAEHLIFTRRPDLCMVHFESSDHVQPGLWCYLDPQDPLFDEERYNYILEHFYGALDKAMKDTWEAFGRAAEGDFTTIVVSDHGFELHRKRFNLGNWLHEQGLLQWSRKLEKPPFHRRLTRAPGFRRLLRLLVPGMSAERPESALHLDPQMIDWDNSATFPVGHNSEAGIHLLHDDAPRRVNTISRITKGLKALRDPFTSAPLIQAVYRKEEVYRGPLMYLMPDLIVVPAPGCTCTTWCWPARPLIEDVHPESDQGSGKHSRDGILVATGRNIAERVAVTAHMPDIAPTILYALGIDIPGDWDGRVVSDVFTSEFLSAGGLPGDGIDDNPG